MLQMSAGPATEGQLAHQRLAGSSGGAVRCRPGFPGQGKAMIGFNYLATEPGRLLFQTHRYLTATRLLRFSETWETDANLIQTPILHLLAHGIELKFKLVELEGSQATVANKFGHDLAKLWAAAPNAEVRNSVLECAEAAWRSARGSGQYQDDFAGDPQRILVESLNKLSGLHSRQTHFGLGYTLPPNTMAPSPGFLVEAFDDAADYMVLSVSGGFPPL